MKLMFMKMDKNKILFLLATIFFSSCLDEVVEPEIVTYSNSADLITYTETKTTFFNGKDKPQLVKVDILYQNINEYFIIDIRYEFDYQLGHVPGAINIKMKDIFDFLVEKNLPLSQKILIISSTGQLASYTSSLLLIAGFENIFSLDGGMTYWNSIFSNELINAQDNAVRYTRYHSSIQSSVAGSTPVILYESNPKTIDEKIKERVKLLLNEPEFNIFISAEEFDLRYSRKTRSYGNAIVIYAQLESLYPTLRYGEVRNIDGPVSSILYDTPYDFSSNKSLLTLPTHKDIILYSDDGQRCIFITAYLKLLGYSAKTIKYGKINMMAFDIRFKYGYAYYIGRRGYSYGVVGYDTIYFRDIKREVRNYDFVAGK